MHDAGADRGAGGCLPGPSHFSRVAERLAAQRRAQRSGARPLQPRVRRELVDEPRHDRTIRPGRCAIQLSRHFKRPSDELNRISSTL